MNKITIAMVSVCAMAGLAGAQATGKGSAAAGAKADVKAGGAAAGAKVDAKAGAAAAAPAAAPMEMPKPPAEIAATLKAMGAKQNCTGTAMGGADMKTEMKFKGSIAHKSDLDGWWIHDSFQGTMGEGKASMKFKMESYMTYDAKAAKWRTSAVMNDGGNMAGTADMKDGKLETMSDMWSNMGQGKMREHGDMTDKKVGMHMWGEASMDGGKTWNKVYDMNCK
jgi:hypothetical protein